MSATFKILLIFIILFLCTGYCFCQFVRISDRVIVAGYVFDEYDSKPLPYVNVYVKKTRIGTITDTSGYFLLSAHLKDTLTISSLGYDNKYIELTDSTADNNKPLIIFMDSRVYELKSVDVIALRRYKQFEYEFTNMRLPEDDYTYAERNFPFRPKDIDYYARSNLSSVGLILSPISALYDAFSKEGKERRKLEELKKKDLIEDEVIKKVDISAIMKLTGMGREETNLFMQWCGFSRDFILNLTEYEFITLIQQKHREFENLKK